MTIKFILVIFRLDGKGKSNIDIDFSYEGDFMGIIFLTLLLGVAVGALVKFNEKQVKIISQLQTLGVLLLLFVMGISVGVNPDIVNKLSEIGMSALVFAILTTLMSVVAVYFVTTIYIRREKAND